LVPPPSPSRRRSSCWWLPRRSLPRVVARGRWIQSRKGHFGAPFSRRAETLLRAANSLLLSAEMSWSDLRHSRELNKNRSTVSFFCAYPRNTCAQLGRLIFKSQL